MGYGVLRPSRKFNKAFLRRLEEKEAQLAQYRPMMRFTLTDKERRLFTAERMCFMSGIDDWIHGEFDKPVARLPCKLIPLLGRDEFFELM